MYEWHDSEYLGKDPPDDGSYHPVSPQLGRAVHCANVAENLHLHHDYW